MTKPMRRVLRWMVRNWWRWLLHGAAYVAGVNLAGALLKRTPLPVALQESMSVMVGLLVMVVFSALEGEMTETWRARRAKRSVGNRAGG